MKLSMAKLTSAGFTIDSTSSALNTQTVNQKKRAIASQLSESEAAFASSLARPTRGSLNLLRHLETANNPSASQPTAASIFEKRSLKAAPPPKTGETFANFCAGIKKQNEVSLVMT